MKISRLLTLTKSKTALKGFREKHDRNSWVNQREQI